MFLGHNMYHYEIQIILFYKTEEKRKYFRHRLELTYAVSYVDVPSKISIAQSLHIK